MIYTKVGFQLQSGSKKIVLTQNMVFGLHQESQKNSLHQRFLYSRKDQSLKNLGLLSFMSSITSISENSQCYSLRYVTCSNIYVCAATCIAIQQQCWQNSLSFARVFSKFLFLNCKMLILPPQSWWIDFFAWLAKGFIILNY